MTRGLSGSAIAATQAANVAPIALVEMFFDSGTVRVCSAGSDFSWNGFNWLGIGQLGKISATREAESGQVSGLKFSLSSIPANLLNTILTEQYQGRKVNVYVGFLALPAYTVIVDPTIEWAGTMDTGVVNDDGKTGELQITAENEMFDFARARPANWGDAEQQTLYPGDLGCQYLPQMATMTLIWPAASYYKAIS